MGNAEAGQLDAIFERYGFQSTHRDSGIHVYTTALGHFQVAEIVLPRGAEESAEVVRSEFQRAGYACKLTTFSSLSQIEEDLFNGFFRTSETGIRLLHDYKQFCKRTTDSLGSIYSYVNVKYRLNGEVPTDDLAVPDLIFTVLQSPGPVLVFLEAPAGFGKTCTSFEVLRRFLECAAPRNPLLAELQRNRQARIFRYVLLDEMDRHYQGLRSSVVEEEIRSGRIPLILDGFDELLHIDRDSHTTTTDIEPMLNTLRDILQGNAKVLVTTRQTAVLGERFDQWIADMAEGASGKPISVHRVALQEPEIADWIGAERTQALSAHSCPIESLANPVLLSFVKNADEATFSSLCCNPGRIVATFFDSLLKREQIRQELPLSPGQQKEILLSLAKRFIDESITSIGREELRRIVLDEHFQTLRDALNASVEISARTPEELADKLTDHALLDAKPGKVAGIGFVNDFVHGTLAGEAMLTRSLPEQWFDQSDLDKATTAYRAQTEDERQRLWTRLANMANVMDPQWQVTFDVALTGSISRSLESCVVEEVTFKNHLLQSGQHLENVVFIRCAFEGIHFSVDNISRAGFVDCVFRRCSFHDEDSTHPFQIKPQDWWFDTDCQFHDMKPFGDSDESAEAVKELDPNDKFERAVLEQFWPPGRPHARFTLQARTLYQGTNGNDREGVQSAMLRLKAAGLIRLEDRLVELNRERMGDIRHILGRS